MVPNTAEAKPMTGVKLEHPIYVNDEELAFLKAYGEKNLSESDPGYVLTVFALSYLAQHMISAKRLDELCK